MTLDDRALGPVEFVPESPHRRFVGGGVVSIDGATVRISAPLLSLYVTPWGMWATIEPSIFTGPILGTTRRAESNDAPVWSCPWSHAGGALHDDWGVLIYPTIGTGLIWSYGVTAPSEVLGVLRDCRLPTHRVKRLGRYDINYPPSVAAREQVEETTSIWDGFSW